MRIGGIQKFSALDYPGKMACVVFCRGCSLRCGYCHNKDLQKYDGQCTETDQSLFAFLESRIGLLDAVVFSGGEPLEQEDLAEKMLCAKRCGFLIGLHTSGISPVAFSRIVDLVDWVGFDIKTCFKKYGIITCVNNSGKFAEKSFDLLLLSKKSFEVRTTYDSRFMTDADLISIAHYLTNKDIKVWIIQECVLRGGKEEVRLSLPSREIMNQLSAMINIEIRR
jgi:anaerobic ribonucleoside-triphosphate reductase activating protein